MVISMVERIMVRKGMDGMVSGTDSSDDVRNDLQAGMSGRMAPPADQPLHEQLARAIQPALAAVLRQMSQIADEQASHALEPIYAVVCEQVDALVSQVQATMWTELERTSAELRSALREHVNRLVEPASLSLRREVDGALRPLTAFEPHEDEPHEDEPHDNASRRQSAPAEAHEAPKAPPKAAHAHASRAPERPKAAADSKRTAKKPAGSVTRKSASHASASHASTSKHAKSDSTMDSKKTDSKRDGTSEKRSKAASSARSSRSAPARSAHTSTKRSTTRSRPKNEPKNESKQ